MKPKFRTRTAAIGSLLATSCLLIGCATTISGQAAPATSRIIADPSSQAPDAGSSSSSSTPSSAEPPSSSSVPSPSGEPTESEPGPPEGAIGAPIPGGSGAGVIPVGLESYYNQTLVWQDCLPYADNESDRELYANPDLECANLIVPLDYDDPTGPTVSVGVLRSAATGDRIGSLLTNPGGPGGSGMSYVAGTVTPVDPSAGEDPKVAELHESFDLIGFDPRGIGGSRPLILCQTDEERDASRAENNRLLTQDDIDRATAAIELEAQQCAERSGADAGIDGAAFLGSVGTDTVVKDMDVLRSVLGDEELSYLGYSYGTRLGYVYADQFTENVRAMILDGAVNPDEGGADSLIGQATGFQATFEAFATNCALKAGCILGDDPSQATAVFQQLVRPLLDEPLQLTDGRVLTFNDAITGTVLALYSESTWDFLEQALLAVAQGQGDQLMYLADYYDGRDADGHYDVSSNALTAVHCVDDAPSEDAGDRDLGAEYNAAAPFQDSGDPVVSLPSICEFWPAQATLTPGPPDAPGLAPVLVISTTGDPATPYESGVALADQLDGVLLTVEGDRHTAYLGAGIDCVDDAGTAYLVDLTLPADGLTCQ